MVQRAELIQRGQVVLGKLRLLKRPELKVEPVSCLSWEEEEARLFRTQHSVERQLDHLYRRALDRTNRDIAAIFSVHATLIKDEDFLEAAQAMIRENKATAEYAVQTVWGGFAAVFDAMENPYMRARGLDIRDVSQRMLRQLTGTAGEDPAREAPAILLADELFPSEVMEWGDKMLGLVARREEAESHTEILLRACQIPALVRADLSPEWNGHLALLDGPGRRLYLDPDRELIDRFRRGYQEERWETRREEMELQLV